MSRFEFRVARLEKSFAPPDAASFVAGLTEAELSAVVIAGHKDMLSEAKTAGAKQLAADLDLVIKRDAAELRAMPDAPHWRRVRALVEQANAAKPIAGEFEGFLVDGKRLPWREYIRHQADDIRFNEQFGDVLGRLEAGETVEYVGEDELLLAAARTRPGKPGRTWCEVELVSSVIPGRRSYIDLRHREDNTPWLPWHRYCRAAEDERARLASVAANPVEAAKATKGGRR